MYVETAEGEMNEAFVRCPIVQDINVEDGTTSATGKSASGKYEVLKKCGEPVAQRGDTWIYEQGSMIRVLTFNYEGRLLRIESRRK